MELIRKYFPELSGDQLGKIELLSSLYKDWNSKINVVSRKDIDEIYLRHVLHSMAISRIQSFRDGSAVLDVGTGGGFPGIPLAIMFPKVGFHLVDSISKKIKVVDEVVEGLGLTNVTTYNMRVENMEGEFDFIVSRAVAQMRTFVRWVRGRIKTESVHDRKNGILYLKGGDLNQELAPFPKAEVYKLKALFEEEFFETKSLVYLPLY